MLNNLRFTKMELDTSMGQAYINKINESSEWPEIGQYFCEIKPNEICKHFFDDYCESAGHYTWISNISDVGMNLAMKIEANTEMFVQLEYLARGTDPRDVRDGHIKLMSQLSRCRDALWKKFSYQPFFTLLFTETTPLYNLASVVSSYYVYSDLYNCNIKAFIVINSKTMRPLAKFFMQLCHDIGFNIELIYTNPIDNNRVKNFTTQHCPNLWWFEPSNDIGCTGVIAERSDIDSAIDAFINSSVTAPWRLKQIYVQESVFEDFKETLAAKSRSTASGDIIVGDKTFLIEHLGGEMAGIPTHAYRTTKELLSLIETPYLSLWVAETALSHEIALRSFARTVWVNEYATFYGPSRTSLSVYDISNKLQCDKTSYNKLKESLKPWAQLQTAERLEIIVTAIKESKDEDVRKELHDFALQYRSEDVIHVTEKTVCFGIQNPMGVVGFFKNGKLSIETTVKTLINGNAVACFQNRFQTDEVFVKELQKLGVPIQYIACETENNCDISCPLILEQLKIIRTNYGTIFAN